MFCICAALWNCIGVRYNEEYIVFCYYPAFRQSYESGCIDQWLNPYEPWSLWIDKTSAYYRPWQKVQINHFVSEPVSIITWLRLSSDALYSSSVIILTVVDSRWRVSFVSFPVRRMNRPVAILAELPLLMESWPGSGNFVDGYTNCW